VGQSIGHLTIKGRRVMDEIRAIIERFNEKHGYELVNRISAIYNEAVLKGDGDTVLLLYRILSDAVKVLGEKLPGGSESKIMMMPEKNKLQ
jgi:hypothetical protein